MSDVLETMSKRTVAIAVDPSEYSEKAFDCEYQQYALVLVFLHFAAFYRLKNNMNNNRP